MAQQDQKIEEVIVTEQVTFKDVPIKDPVEKVHSFNPEDSPEEKAKSVSDSASSSTAAAVISDIGGGSEGEVLTLPGTLVITSASDIPSWARIGWERVANKGATYNPEEEYFSEVLGELYLGHLWLNASVVIVAVFATWFVTVIGFGFSWVVIIAVFVAQYFRISVKRFNRNARSDISRELAKTRLETDYETTQWLNEFLRRFWLIYEPVLSATIVQSVDAVLEASTPNFLDSIRLSTFTLGTKSPIIESIKSYPKTDDDIVIMDWRLAFEPNDLANMSKAQLDNKVNPKIVLTIRVGKGIVGAGMPILLEDISFTGLMRIKLKLTHTFPHIQTVWLSFLEEPRIDFALKPVGGETFGFDIANIPGLSSFIHEQVHASLRPMMYDPNVYPLDIEAMMAGIPLDSAVGILKLTLYNAVGLKNAEVFGVSDPYVKLSLNGQQEIARTKVINDTLNPHWNETHFLLLTSLQETLHMEIFDKNVSRDKLLGIAMFSCQVLKDDPVQEQNIVPVIFDGKQFGTIRFDAQWCPVPSEEAAESNSGILRFTIHQAKDIDPVKSIVGKYSPYAELMLNGNVLHRTRTVKKNNNPVFEESKEIFITDKATAKLSVAVRDARDFAEDPVVAGWTSNLVEFMQALESKNDWFNDLYSTTGKLRLSCKWKPIVLDHTPTHAGYVDPIGVIKLKVHKAQNLKNVEQFGKSDPYARVHLGPVIRGRTQHLDDTLNPVWDSIIYVPVHSLKESIGLEVMDFEKSNKDRPLGHTEFLVNRIAKLKEDGTYEAIETISTAAPLILQCEPKGELHYTAVFHPTLPVKKPEEKQAEEEKEQVEEEKKPESEVPAETLLESSESVPEANKPEPVENVLDYQTGILIITLNRADLDRKNVYAELLVDEIVYPFFRTGRCKTANPDFKEVADVFIRELDFSRLNISFKQEDRHEPIGVAQTDVKNLLRQAMAAPEDGVWLPIIGTNITEAKVNLHARYVPVPVELEAIESVNNMGVLQITLKDAKDLPAADRSGTSDPYVRFFLNDKKEFESKTVKKNCNPIFDEKFEVQVLSRETSKFSFDVFDWNAITKHAKLGGNVIDLTELQPFEALEKNYPLLGASGSIRVIMVFRPEFVFARKRSSLTFATRAFTHVATSSISSISGVIEGGASIVDTGTSLVGSGAKLVDTGTNLVGSGAKLVDTGTNLVGSSAKLIDTGTNLVGSSAKLIDTGTNLVGSGAKLVGLNTATVELAAVTPVSLEKNPNETIESASTILRSGTLLVDTPQAEQEKETGYNWGQSSDVLGESGTLTVQILEAENLKAVDRGGTSDPFVKVFYRQKEIHKTAIVKKTTSPTWKDEVIKISITSEPAKIIFSLKDYNLLGKDVDLGDVDVNVWDNITGNNRVADIWKNVMNGEGRLHLRLEFAPSEGGDESGSENVQSLKKLKGLTSTFRNKA